MGVRQTNFVRFISSVHRKLVRQMSNPELRFAPEMSARRFARELGIGYGLAYGEAVDILEGRIVEPQGTMLGIVKIGERSPHLGRIVVSKKHISRLDRALATRKP